MKVELKNDVLINRKILEWEWYKDVNTYKLFTHLIYKANYEDSLHRGVKVKRGQVYTGLEKLKYETGLSVQNIKTSLKKLTLTSEITSISTNKYRLITLIKYDTYQLNNKQPNKQSKQRLDDELTASNKKKELKELKEVNKKEYYVDVKLNGLFIDFLKMRKNLKAVNSERAINTLINKLSAYDDTTKYKMLENSIMNSWKGVFELKAKNGYKQKGELPKDVESDWLDDYMKTL